MNPLVSGHLATQNGLVTRLQAVEAGMRPHQIDQLVRRKFWTVVRKGVYAETEYVATLRPGREQRLLLDRAVGLRIRSPFVLSHHSSAYLLDMQVLHERPALTHVTRPGIVGSHQRRNVKHHRAPYDRRSVVEVDGLLCLDPARTALDIARECGFRHGLVAADSALRLGCSRGDLQAQRARMVSWPYAQVMDDVIASAHPDTDSIGETLTRELVVGLGFGVPKVQFGLTANGRTVWCDLCLGRHIVEFDGRVKYLPPELGGFAAGTPDEALWEEKQRQDFISSFKLGFSRVTWDDLWGKRRRTTEARLEREYRDTCARFGTDISDLAPYRPRGPRPRPRTPTFWAPAA